MNTKKMPQLERNKVCRVADRVSQVDGQLLFPGLFELERNKVCRVADRVSQVDGQLSWNWSWRSSSIPQSESGQLVSLCNLIGTYNFRDSRDKWLWEIDSNGSFSVRSLRILLEFNRIPPDLCPISWCAWSPVKVRCFAWRARLERIPVKVALAARGIPLQSVECSLCFGAAEDVNHILLHCPFAAAVWEAVHQWCGLVIIDVASIREISLLGVKWSDANKSEKIHICIIMAVFWFLWLQRNAVIFNSEVLSVPRVVDRIKTQSFFWFKSRSGEENLVWSDWCNFSL